MSTDIQQQDTDVIDEVDESKAPLIEHLIELRSRLLKTVVAVAIAFIVCFFFASDIFNILVVPYEHAVGRRAAGGNDLYRAAGIFLHPTQTGPVWCAVHRLSDYCQSGLYVRGTGPLQA